MKNLYVNNTKIVTEGFRGINFIHQLYEYMPDKLGRVFTEAQVEKEIETLKKMGVKMIRSFYGSSLSWDRDKKCHDFENEHMQAFYKSCKLMQDAGIEVGITPQWHFQGLLKEIPYESQYPRVDLGYNGCVVEGDLEATAKNFEKFMEESVLAFERHGIHNIKYLYCFTECNNMFNGRNREAKLEAKLPIVERREYDCIYPIFDRIIKAIDQGLKNAGKREQYKIVAPCDNWRADDGSEPYSLLVKYCVDNLSEYVDIIGSHNGYDRSDEFTNPNFYTLPVPKLTNPKEEAEKAGKEYWADEFNVALHSVYSYQRHEETDGDPMRGVAFGALINSIMNMGYVHNMLVWALYGQQWPDHTNTGGEFKDGVHVLGYLQNIMDTEMPHPAWYSVAMLTRYVSSGDTYDCKVDDNIFVSAIKRDDGEFTVVVTNYNDEPTDFTVNFEKALGGKTLYRYVYDPKTVVCTEELEMIKSDKTIEGVEEGFSDSFSGYGVAVYTTEKA